jgi:nucleotide-binding universal stress UspA family protein
MPDRPTFHRVLVAVDGSLHSDLALSIAIALAERDHARLTVLTVIPHVAESSAALGYGAAIDPVQLQEDADREAAQTMRAAIDAVPDGQPVDAVTRRGSSGSEIVAQITDGDHDVVIVGARGLGRIGSLFGSVSQYVLHHAGIAAFVAHAPED